MTVTEARCVVVVPYFRRTGPPGPRTAVTPFDVTIAVFCSTMSQTLHPPSVSAHVLFESGFFGRVRFARRRQSSSSAPNAIIKLCTAATDVGVGVRITGHSTNKRFQRHM